MNEPLTPEEKQRLDLLLLKMRQLHLDWAADIEELKSLLAKLLPQEVIEQMFNETWSLLVRRDASMTPFLEYLDGLNARLRRKESEGKA